MPWYDYELYNARGQKLKLQARGHRKLLSYNFPVQTGGFKRLDAHRVFAMNDLAHCNVRALH